MFAGIDGIASISAGFDAGAAESDDYGAFFALFRNIIGSCEKDHERGVR